ncbi:MAG: HNH endonuclease signature motif containing protein [Candidatus Binatia bacterium]
MTNNEWLPTSRNIPPPMQREIRQRCGFGCVVCGMPLYEYDHLLGWANVHRHVADEITLLCDHHHREKGTGLLPSDAVEAANRDPHNLRAGVSKPYDLHYSGDECEVIIGGNRFSTKFAGYGTMLVPVSVDGTALLAFVLGDGHLMLNLNVFDEYNQLVLQIENNQLVQFVSPWDIQFVGHNLVIREAKRKILVDISFEPPGRIVVQRGRFLRNGVEILVRSDRVVIANSGATFSGTRVRNWPGGVVVGPHDKPMPAIILMPNVPRYRHDRKLVESWIAEEFETASKASKVSSPPS